MKAVVLSVVLFLTLSVSIPANGASLPESDLELQLLKAPSTSLVVHSRNRRAVDVYDFTRYLIANLIEDLQNAVNAVSNAVGNLTTTIRAQRDQFLANLNSSVQDIITQVETVIQNVVNMSHALTGAISQCVDEQRSAAQTLVETTVANLSGCLNNTLTGINSILWDARNLADSASSLAQNVSAKVASCGTASWSNFVQVGSCLNQILRDQQPAIDALINKISNAVVHAGFVVTGIPTNLVICSGTSIAQAGFTGLQIAQNIRTCTGNALGGMQSYSSKTYFGNVRGPPIKYVDYDMLYDKTPYNPKSKRGDRREQKISWRNIWEQEKEKGVASTSHFMYGRPKRKQYDYAIKEFCRKTEDKEFRSKRLETALQWALPLDISKFTPL